MNILWGILGFIVTIGILVGVHEWGHFAVARFFDVKILRFSLGFGSPIISWTGKKDGTRYTLAPIPLGGFVQMYGESEHESSENALDYHRTFTAKPAWQRFFIIFAGPAINLIFAVLIFALLFMTGVEGISPTVLHVQEHSLAAQAGLQRGDVLTAINDHKILLAADAHIAFVGAPRKSISVQYRRDDALYQTTLNLSSLRAGDEQQMPNRLGLYLADDWWPAIVDRVITAENAADLGVKEVQFFAGEALGLQSGDKIIAIDGMSLADDRAIFELSEQLSNRAQQKIRLTVMRGEKELHLSGILGSREIRGKTYGFLGVTWKRAPNKDFFEQYQIVERYDFLPALVKGAQKTGYYIHLTFSMFGRMLTGQIGLENIGGPLTIGDAAGQTLQIGWAVFLNFLGIVSLSLAAINLLPIPMLDGGHMLFTALEMLRRKPLSERTMNVVFKIGQFVVLTFMGFVLLNDFWRYLS
ncbi:RIP metalloprotease RseP [Dichelobacter nodosus]|nr:RIP metalloprotease RseP [Dichelobacter nodosus]TGA66265.1 RIP metalloprotease RseP [Dichelobacter nodosus]